MSRSAPVLAGALLLTGSILGPALLDSPLTGEARFHQTLLADLVIARRVEPHPTPPAVPLDATASGRRSLPPAGATAWYLPGFLAAHLGTSLTSADPADGRSPPYRIALSLSTLLVGLALVALLVGLLEREGAGTGVIALSLAGLLGGTGLLDTILARPASTGIVEALLASALYLAYRRAARSWSTLAALMALATTAPGVLVLIPWVAPCGPGPAPADARDRPPGNAQRLARVAGFLIMLAFFLAPQLMLWQLQTGSPFPADGLTGRLLSLERTGQLLAALPVAPLAGLALLAWLLAPGPTGPGPVLAPTRRLLLLGALLASVPALPSPGDPSAGGGTGLILAPILASGTARMLGSMVTHGFRLLPLVLTVALVVHGPAARGSLRPVLPPLPGATATAIATAEDPGAPGGPRTPSGLGDSGDRGQTVSTRLLSTDRGRQPFVPWTLARVHQRAGTAGLLGLVALAALAAASLQVIAGPRAGAAALVALLLLPPGTLLAVLLPIRPAAGARVPVWSGAGRILDPLDATAVWIPPPGVEATDVRLITRLALATPQRWNVPVAILDVVDSEGSIESRVIRSGSDVIDETVLIPGARSAVQLRLVDVARYDLVERRSPVPGSGPSLVVRPTVACLVPLAPTRVIQALGLRLVQPAAVLDVESVTLEARVPASNPASPGGSSEE